MLVKCGDLCRWKEKKCTEVCKRRRVAEECVEKVEFRESVAPEELNFLKKHFRLSSWTVVSLADIKGVALYTATIDIPKDFVAFLHCQLVDTFLRSLIAYFQYFLPVCNAPNLAMPDLSCRLFVIAGIFRCTT